jgi:hypothetical protein
MMGEKFGAMGEKFHIPPDLVVRGVTA